MVRISRVACALLVCAFSLAALANNSTAEAETQVVLDSTQIFTLYSASLKQTYRIQAHLPASYATNSSKQYPLIIKVDGQWDFPLAASVFNNIYFDGQMPETIIIGIDWSDVTGNIHEIRARDLLPAPVEGFKHSGQAKQFIAALTKEIIPALQKRYRLNGQEFLLGGSWGATFVTYALLAQPDVFDGAIAIAGDYKRTAKVFDQQLTSLANTQTLKGKRLYLGVGKGDQVAPDVLAYADKLAAAKLSGFNVKVDARDGFGHSGMNVPGYASGYQYMFERPNIALTPAILVQWVGDYISPDKGAPALSIQIESQTLVAKINGQKISVKAKADNEFYHPDHFFNLRFDGAQVKLETFFGETNYQRK